jgi:hypothetical protein
VEGNSSVNRLIEASASWTFLDFGCLLGFFGRFACLVCCFRATLCSVYLSHKFRIQRSVWAYVDIFGDNRCEMSARSISVSEAE